MMHAINVCKKCGGEPVYIHLPLDASNPAEHKIICKNCSFETEVHKYSTAAIKDWNQKRRA